MTANASSLQEIALAYHQHYCDRDGVCLGVTCPGVRGLVALLESAQPQWQPIETAPIDGTFVLGFRNRGNGGQSGEFTHVTCFGRAGWSTIPGKYSWGPTHWMPLPQAPVGGVQ